MNTNEFYNQICDLPESYENLEFNLKLDMIGIILILLEI
ncbi:hypothetical protein BH20ACI1_BH20ACI1_16730 [soil metagenome]